MEELHNYIPERGKAATYDWDAILAPGSRRMSHLVDFKCTLIGFCSQLRKEACRRNKLRKDGKRAKVSLSIENESTLVVTVQTVPDTSQQRPTAPAIS